MIRLYDHQNDARIELMKRKSYALFLDQGTGKTLIMLYHLAYLFQHGLVKNALVVAPKSAVGAWSRDLEKIPKERREQITNIEVVNYDIIHRRDRFINGKFDVIILDESHYIKNRGSKRSKALRKMGKSAKYRYILTGTPMTNSKLHEFYAQYDFLDPCIFTNWTTFTNRFVNMGQYYQPESYRNKEILETMINAHAMRLTKEECLDLPEKLPDEVILVPLLEKKYYKEAMENFIQEFDLVVDNPLVRSLRMRQIASGFLTDDETTIELKSEKLNYMQEIIEGREEKQTVIFANFKHSIKTISERLNKMKIKHLILNGDQPDKEIWKVFQEDPSYKVIIVQYQTGSAGIDLYKADAIIYYEPTLSSSTNEQSRDRIHRIGQNMAVTYYYLLTKGTIEEKIYKTLKTGRDFSKEVLQDYAREENKVA